MTFTRKSANLIPIQDTVFAIVDMAKKDIAENGPEHVVDATIGSLYDEEGKLVALKTVFEHYNEIDDRIKAAYAASFTGNPDYRTAVYDWVTQGSSLHLAHSVIATPGGTGADATSMITFLEQGETVLLPDIAWGSYKLMASQNNFKAVTYEMFDGDHFNLNSVREKMEEILKVQNKIVLVVNDPCHNPTGYSLSYGEWEELIALLNEFSTRAPIVLIDDIAYIDYSNDLEHSRTYMNTFNNISENVMISIAFSCSKTLTSYGLRCGAAVLLAKRPEDVREVEIVFEKSARALWSNIPNAAMKNFVYVTTEGKDAFLKEKQTYIDLVRTRSSIFLKEAEECGLSHYPYKEGFFITLNIPDSEFAQKLHAAFLQEHIYTVLVNKGIRIAMCSLPVEKVKGLAGRMKKIEDELTK